MTMLSRLVQVPARIQPTYEELKPHSDGIGEDADGRIQPTYEELKPDMLALLRPRKTGYPAYL